MKIKMLRNPGTAWGDAAAYREGTEHEVSATLGNRLAAAGLCEVLERDVPPAPTPKAAPQQSAKATADVVATDAFAILDEMDPAKMFKPPAVKQPTPPQQPHQPRQHQPKRGK